MLQGVKLRSNGDPVLYLSNPGGLDQTVRRGWLDDLGALNRMRQEAVGDPEIATRIAQYEMAFRMQTSVPELMDIAREPKEIQELYGAEPGKSSFATPVPWGSPRNIVHADLDCCSTPTDFGFSAGASLKELFAAGWQPRPSDRINARTSPRQKVDGSGQFNRMSAYR
jgi:hypothetical protein